MPPRIKQNFQVEVRKFSDNPALFCHRERLTAAQVNAGYTLLPALRRGQYRLCDLSLIAIGGNAAGATSVNLVGTVNAVAINLGVAAIAGLVRSAVLRLGAANFAVLADGASFVSMDVGKPITVTKVGSDMTTATHIDAIIWYAIDNFD